MAGWGGRRAEAFTRLVLAWYGTRCHLCGDDGATTADHLVPLSKGGAPYDLDNARPAHLGCNARRGARPLPRPDILADGVAFVDLT